MIPEEPSCWLTFLADKEIFFLVLGWLLGFLPTILWETYKDRKKAAEFKKLALLELKDHCARFGMTFYLISIHRGNIDRTRLSEVFQFMAEYDGPMSNNRFRLYSKSMISSNLSDEKFNEGFLELKQKDEKFSTNRPISFYSIEHGLEAIATREPEFARLLLEIQNRMNNYNHILTEFQEYKSIRLNNETANIFSQTIKDNMVAVEDTLRESSWLLFERIRNFISRKI